MGSLGIDGPVGASRTRSARSLCVACDTLYRRVSYMRRARRRYSWTLLQRNLPASASISDVLQRDNKAVQVSAFDRNYADYICYIAWAGGSG